MSPAGRAEAAAAAATAAEADGFRINRRSLSNAGGFQQAPFSSPPTPLVLLTTVDVGGGRVESVTVSDGDDVKAAAEAFCEEHSLPAAVVAPLAAHLAENLLAARRARAAARRRTTTEAAAATAAWAAAAGGGGNDEGPNPILPPPPRSLLAAAAGTAEETAALQVKRFDFDFVEEEEEETVATNIAAAAVDSPPLALAAAGEEGEQVGIVTAAVRNEHTMPSSATPGYRLPHSRDRQQQHAARQGATAARRAGAAASGGRAAVASSSNQQQHHQPPSKMTWVSAQLASGRSKGPYESYAHRLYAEGLEAIRARAVAAEAAAARKEEAELDGATWTPSVNRSKPKGSSDASASRNSSRRKNNAWERLSATPLRKAAEQDRLERLREERLEAEAAECTFAPAVSRGTKKIIAAREEARSAGGAGTGGRSTKGRAASLYESLYHDAERRRQRAAQEEALYAPWSTKKKATGASGDKSKDKNPPAVALRLLARRVRVDARLAAERDAAERRPVDPLTGRPLFAPSVGRPPHDIPPSSSSSLSASLPSSRSRQRVRPSDTSVGDFLFQQQRAIEERRAAAVARADAALAAASAARAIPKSNEMMARLRGRRFRQIHRYLANGLERAKNAPPPSSSSRACSAATTPREGGAAAAAVVPLDALPPLDLAAAADASLLASIDPEVAADVAAAARLAEAAGVVVSSSSFSSLPPALLDAAAFAALMDAVVRRSGVPRAYLQPRGGRRCSSSGNNASACCAAASNNSHHLHVPGSRHHARCGGHEAETFAPAILPESVALAEAAGRRPAGVDVVRAMEADAAAAAALLERSRERLERQELSECTFRPRLMAQERPVKGARDPAADAVAAARARTQVGRGLVLPVADVAARARRRFAEGEEEEVDGGGEEEAREREEEEETDDGSGRALGIPSLPFLQRKSLHQRPHSPGVGRYERLDYELRAALVKEEEKGGEEKPAGAPASTLSRDVFNISVSASATGAFFAPSSADAAGPSSSSKPLPESMLEALRALAVEASERKRGEEKERNKEQREVERLEQQMLPRAAKSRGGGWQMTL